MKNVIFDCDDVLLNWTEGFREYLNRERGITCQTPSPTSWDMSNWTGLGKAKTWKEISLFNEESKDFSKLNPIDGAIDSVREIKSQGYKLHVITSCSSHDDCVSRRKENLTSLFGNVFNDIHCIPLGASKENYLKIYDPSFWIEDNVQNAIIGHKIGHKSIIRLTEHNKSLTRETPPGITWASNWNEIEKEIFNTTADAIFNAQAQC